MQCDEAVGINRRLMRYKWNPNVLQLPSAPPLRRSLGHAPVGSDDGPQGEMWRIEEERMPPGHQPSAGPIAYQAGASHAASMPTIRHPVSSSSAPPVAPPSDTRAVGEHSGSASSHTLVPHFTIATSRWEGFAGVGDGAGPPTHPAAEKEDSWASARETKPGAGYYTSQPRCRSPYSSGYSSGPYASGGGSASDGGSGGSTGISAPPRMYSRTDVNFDPSSIKHCITIGSPSHPPGGARTSGNVSVAGAGTGGVVSCKHASPVRDLAAFRK